MTKLTDTQCILLSTAAVREDGMLLPIPETLSSSQASALKAVTKLVASGLAVEIEVSSAALAIRSDGDAHIGAAITETGLTAIGVVVPGTMEQPAAAEAQMNTVSPVPAPPTKSALVLSLLRRGSGASLAELVDATGWLPHPTRAALTGLRKKGHSIDRRKRGDETCYHLSEEAA